MGRRRVMATRVQQPREAEKSAGLEFRSYVVDPESANFDWASDDCPDGKRADRLVAAIEKDLVARRAVTLGMMMSTWVPITRRGWRHESRDLARTPLLDLNMILVDLRARVSHLRAFVRWREFVDAAAPKLYVWEAFRAEAKKDRDISSTLARFIKATAADNHGIVFADEEVLSLVGAVLLRSGLSDDITLLRTPCVLVGAPEPDEDEVRRDRERRDKELLDYMVQRALIVWFKEHGQPHHAALLEAEIEADLKGAKHGRKPGA